MKKLLAVLALLVVVAVAFAGEKLACGAYSGGGVTSAPYSIVANEPIWPAPACIWVGDVCFTWDEEDGRYEHPDGAGGCVAFEFIPPDTMKKTNAPFIGPPYTETGNYTESH